MEEDIFATIFLEKPDILAIKFSMTSLPHHILSEKKNESQNISYLAEICMH